jgi:ubiquinone/menaquinone biosynthesis C-methylase UbiE
MIAVDDHHWWYKGRREIVKSQIRQLALPAAPRILDAGCGSGCTLDALQEFGEVSGCDINPLAIESAQARGHEDVREGNLEDIPFDDDAFDLVTCLDVIEHVADDRRALTELRRVTRPGGRLLVTVPAYQWLWSAHDVANHHMRRYTRGSLLPVTKSAGWRLEYDTYFYSWLLPAAATVRGAKRIVSGFGKPDNEKHSELDTTPEALNSMFESASAIENRWLKRRKRLPAGLSLLAVFVNPESEL